MGLSNGFGSMAGFIVPAIKSAVVGETKDVNRWRLVFGIPAIIYGVATIGFLLFASGEVQSFDWRSYSGKDDSNVKEGHDNICDDNGLVQYNESVKK